VRAIVRPFSVTTTRRGRERSRSRNVARKAARAQLERCCVRLPDSRVLALGRKLRIATPLLIK
jgi:hypothetical protein